MTLQETCLDCRRIAYPEVMGLKQVNYRANMYRLVFCTEGNRDSDTGRNINDSEKEWQFTCTLISFVSTGIFGWKSV